jgi:lipid II:glycine glycyltransferase (peptidoglycan interpeptide bridge formation enzyme)
MFRLSVYYQARVEKKPFGFTCKPFYTILNALDIPEQEILKGFTSTVRNEIRRSERENVQCGLMDSLDEFRRFHNEFAVAKGTYLADEGLIDGYKDKLVITCAALDQRILAAHAYLCDREAGTVRLLLSSNIRLTERIDANFIGRANKFLHFKDMIHFKENGYLVYDFGGVAYNTNEKQRQGINAFKQSFGGKLVQNTDYQSWLYWLSSKVFYRIADMKRRFFQDPRYLILHK